MPPGSVHADPSGVAPPLAYPIPMPGAFADGAPDPLSTVTVQMRNDLDEGAIQSRLGRMAAESRGWDGIYGGGGPVRAVNGAVTNGQSSAARA